MPAGLAKGLDIGGAFHYQSGAPLTGQGFEFAGYRNYEYYLTERGSLGRGPSDYEADFHLGYPIQLGANRLSLLFDVFNVFNRQSITTLDNRMNLGSDANCAIFAKDGGNAVCNAFNEFGIGFGGWANIPGTNKPVGKFADARAAALNP